MIQEDKDLLFKDLCARLPYGTKCIVTKSRTEEGQKGDVGRIVRVCLEGVDCIDNTVFFSEFGNFKPYLFPLSSMTDKQAKEIQEIIGDPNYACIMRKTGGLELWLESTDTDPTIWLDTIFEVQDYLNKNKFDYRGLIKMGLAIDATGLNIY